jgi:hypothetical protein
MEILPEEVFSKYPKWFRPNVTTLTTSVNLRSPGPGLAPIDKSVPLETLFHLIPISRMSLTSPKDVDEIKIPWPGRAGIFLSCYYCNSVRGIVKKRKRGRWKNSIFIDVSTSSKNINIGLSHWRMVVTGAKNFNEIGESVKILLETLNFMNLGCKTAQENPKLAREIVQEILRIGTCGPRIGNLDTITSDTITFDPEEVAEILLSEKDFPEEELDSPEVKDPVYLIEENDELEEDLRSVLTCWFYLLIQDYLNLQDATQKLNWAVQLCPFLHQDLEEQEYEVVLAKMRLYVPDLPLDKLYEAFEQTGDFCLTYEPMVLPYLKVQKLVEQVKKNGANCHSINIKPGGQIDLSCIRIDELVDLLAYLVQIYSNLAEYFRSE